MAARSAHMPDAMSTTSSAWVWPGSSRDVVTPSADPGRDGDGVRGHSSRGDPRPHQTAGRAVRQCRYHRAVRRQPQVDQRGHRPGVRRDGAGARIRTPVTGSPRASRRCPAGEAELLGTKAREVYAELVVLGLATWPEDVFEVVVSRPERRIDQQDVHRWPTPLKSYLRGSS